MLQFFIYSLLVLDSSRKLSRLFKKQDKPKKNNIVDIDNIFYDFVGNQRAIVLIKRMVRVALKENKALSPIGLFGPRSSGKTELSRRIAKAMGLPFLSMNKSSIKSEDLFVASIQEFIVGNKTKPFIVFIDEAHLIPRKMQDLLLTALERDDRTIVCNNKRIITNNISFIVATTEPDKLSEAFRSRLVNVELMPYTSEEVVKILQNRINKYYTIKSDVHNISHDGLTQIAIAARNIPRVAIELLEQISQAIKLGDIGTSVDDIKIELNRTFGFDQHGLNEREKQYLLALNNSGCLSLQALCDILETEKNTVSNVIETHLVRKGLITKTTKGRKLTDQGRRVFE